MPQAINIHPIIKKTTRSCTDCLRPGSIPLIPHKNIPPRNKKGNLLRLTPPHSNMIITPVNESLLNMSFRSDSCYNSLNKRITCKLFEW